MVDVVEVKRLEPVKGSDSMEENAHEAMTLLLQVAGAKNIRSDNGTKWTTQIMKVSAERVEDVLGAIGVSAFANSKRAFIQKLPECNSKYAQRFIVCPNPFRAIAEVDGHKCTAYAFAICGDPELDTVFMMVAERDDGHVYNPSTAEWEEGAGKLSMCPANHFTTDMIAAHKKAGKGKLTSKQATAILEGGIDLILTVMKVRMMYPHKVCFDFAAGCSPFEGTAAGDLIVQNGDHFHDVYFGIQVCPGGESNIRLQDEITEEIKDAAPLNSESGELPEEVGKFIKKYWH